MTKRKRQRRRDLQCRREKKKRVLCVMSYIFIQCDSKKMKVNRKINEIKMKENQKREMELTAEV